MLYSRIQYGKKSMINGCVLHYSQGQFHLTLSLLPSSISFISPICTMSSQSSFMKRLNEKGQQEHHDVYLLRYYKYLILQSQAQINIIQSVNIGLSIHFNLYSIEVDRNKLYIFIFTFTDVSQYTLCLLLKDISYFPCHTFDHRFVHSNGRGQPDPTKPLFE